ncbi:TasA family protein [Nocardioides terrisoli]|uniref:TasA family protein n=1 Tax=Nocardioides terrisoli TaxID=3388267 RepID=UPI00287BBF88|nr:TasA family protein [Nocardioides marmorisolisilvae]
MATTRAKILVPLATLIAAGAVAVGSGATFTSESAHSVSVTSGTLHHTNSQNGATLTVSNLKPGDTQSGTLTIKNDGNLDSTLALTPTAASSGFATGAVNLEITNGTTVVYNGDIGAMTTGTAWDLGALPVGQTDTLTYTVSMASTADNTNQGKSASASFSYVTTQTNTNGGVLNWVSGV